MLVPPPTTGTFEDEVCPHDIQLQASEPSGWWPQTTAGLPSVTGEEEGCFLLPAITPSKFPLSHPAHVIMQSIFQAA